MVEETTGGGRTTREARERPRGARPWELRRPSREMRTHVPQRIAAGKTRLVARKEAVESKLSYEWLLGWIFV